jgi:hypothetical protein
MLVMFSKDFNPLYNQDLHILEDLGKSYQRIYKGFVAIVLSLNMMFAI